MTTITTRVNKTTELSYGEGDDNVAQDIGTKSGAYTADIDDNRTTYECTGTWAFELPVASAIVNPAVTFNDDYEVTVTNVGTDVVTVTTQGTDTVDGLAQPGDFRVQAGASYTFKVNAGKDGYIINKGRESLYAGRVSGSNPVSSSTLPAGWSAATSGTGVYTVTHSLGLASSQYAVCLTIHDSTGTFQYVSGNVSVGPNTFTYTLERVDGTNANLGCSFIMMLP